MGRQPIRPHKGVKWPPAKCDCDERIGERCPHPKHDVDTIALVSKGKYVFTEAEIDAAWSKAHTYCDRREVLKKLGIVRCEGCNGSGTVDVAEVDGRCIETHPCPSCNGHGWVKDGINEIERLRERIAELEKPRMPDDTIGVEHYITDAQIDAAWTILQRVNKSLSKDKSWRVTVEHILEPLGIVRCEGCWDCADAGGPQDGVRCNGHGWIKPAQLVDKCGQFGTTS